jgi:hypothetical protein
MKILHKSNLITMFAGIGSGVTISIITTIILYNDLFNGKLSIENIFVLVPLYFIGSSIIYSAILGGLGIISGYIIHKSFSDYLKYLVLIQISLFGGLIGFFLFDQSQLSKLTFENVEKLATSYFFLFSFFFLLYQIPIYVHFLRKR